MQHKDKKPLFIQIRQPFNKLLNVERWTTRPMLGRDQNFSKLINEKSPYLLQHAYNPVNWYPWGKEAFAKAKAENKPIFLRIGYSSCHWWHIRTNNYFKTVILGARIVCKKGLSLHRNLIPRRDSPF